MDKNEENIRLKNKILDLEEEIIKLTLKSKTNVNETIYKNILEHSTNAFYSHTPDHQITYFSKQASNILGYTPEEMMIKWMELASDHPMNEEGYKKTVLAIETGVAQAPYELELIHKTGRTVYVEVHEAPVVENGKTIAIVGALTDITNQKIAGTGLKESEEKFRLLFEKSKDPILILDEYKFVECNNATIEILGYQSKEELFNVHPSKLSPEYQPDGMLSFDKAQEMMDIAYEEGYHRFEWIHTNKAGNNIYMDIALTKIPYKGKDMLFTSWRDISKQKEYEKTLIESEKQYSTLFEQAADGILVGIKGGEIVEANQSILNLTGYKKNELIGKNVGILFEKEELGSKPLRYDLVKKGDTVIKERNIVKKDGTTVPVEMNTKILEDGRMQSLYRDLSKRKEAEIAMQESEEKYRNIFLNSPLGILHYDNKGCITDCNEHFVNIIGSKKESLIGLNMLKSLKNKKLIKAIKESVENGKGYFEDWYKSITADKLTYVRILFKSIIDDNNKVISGIGLVEDITERKKAEEALKERTYFLNKIIESSAISMWISDDKGTAIRSNPACLKLFGATEEEVTGKYNLFNDSVIKKHGLMPEIKRVFEKGEVANLVIDYNFGEVDHVDVKNATHKIINTILTPVIDINKKVSNVIVQAIDLSDIKKAEEDLKKSEQKFRLLFENSQDGIFITDNKGFIDCNTQAIKMFGVERKEDILSKTLVDLSPDYQPDGEKSKEKSKTFLYLANKGKKQIFEWLHKRMDGSTFYAEVSLIPFNLDNKQYLQSIVRDITERKEIEQRILDTIIETEQKERQRLASDIHDEIGPLLSSMKMYIESINENNNIKKQIFLKEKLQDLVKESIINVREVSNALSPYLLNKYGLKVAIKAFFEKSKELIDISFETNLKVERFPINIEIAFYRIIKELFNNTIKHAKAKNIYILLNYIDNNLILNYEDDGIGINIKDIESLEKKGIGLFNITNRIMSIKGNYQFITEKKKGFGFQLAKEIKKL